MFFLGALSVLFGLGSIAAGALDIFRAINPSALANAYPDLFTFVHTLPALGLGAISLFFAFLCRKVARKRTKKRYGTSGSVTASVLGIVLSLVSLPVTNLFPNGVITDSSADSALALNGSFARTTIEDSTGACTSGWKTLSTSAFPGVTNLMYCTSLMTSFAGFNSATMAKLYRSPLQSQILSSIKMDADTAQLSQLPSFSSLNSDTWTIIGPTETLQKLRLNLGGDLAAIDPNKVK